MQSEGRDGEIVLGLENFADAESLWAFHRDYIQHVKMWGFNSALKTWLILEMIFHPTS